MGRLTIGQFSESFPPLMDGVGFVVKNYTELLKDRGHEVHAVVSGAYADEGYAYDRQHGIDYTIRASMVPVPGINPYGVVMQGRKFRTLVDEIPFDIIHTHAPFFLARYAEKLAKVRHIPLVTTFHTLYKDDFMGFTHSKHITEHLTRMILRHYRAADAVWTTTEWSKKKLHEYGFDGEVTVMRNGCDMLVPSAEAYAAYRAAGRASLGLSGQRPLLIYVGQLKVEKNLKLTVEALGIAHARNADFHMVFVGTGPDRTLLENLVEERKLQDMVTFTGKIMDRERLKTMLAASDLFLFPSQYDTSSLVMQEAAAFGVPLLNTEGSGTAAVTDRDVNGFITKNDPLSYADRLMQLLGDMALVKDAGDRARKTIYRHWSTVVDEVESRYLELHAMHAGRS